jgi:hypothetical protein
MISVPIRLEKGIYRMCKRGIVVVTTTMEDTNYMAETTESTEISSGMVIGIGVVLFVVIVGIWYLFLR